MRSHRWMARIRADIRGYPLLRRETWYPIIDSSDMGHIVSVWGKEIFIFAEDADTSLVTAGNRLPDFTLVS